MLRANEEVLGFGPRDPIAQIGLGLRELFKGLRLAVADRFTMSCFLSFGLVVAAFGAFGLSWWGASGTVAVGVQMAYLTSGGLGGLALLGAGLGVLYLQVSRRLEAHEDHAWTGVLDRALSLLAAVKASAHR